MNWVEIITDILMTTIRLSTPITLAAIGATICERSGIVNIALEGMMLMGAFFAVAVTLATKNPWLGVLAGVLGGGLFSLLHAWATVTLHLEHVISGAVINILALGITRYLMVLFYGHPGNTKLVEVSMHHYKFAIPLLSEIPIVGTLFFNQTPIVYLSFIIIIFFAFFMRYSKPGLHIRASGEHPMALETMGVSVTRVRYLAVVISGLLAGLAGAYMSIEHNSSFTEGMTGGRGFIAIAANVSGGWSVIGSFIAALFFGFVETLGIRFQITKLLPIDAEYFLMFPYVAAVFAVAFFVRRSRSPKECGNDFMIEEGK